MSFSIARCITVSMFMHSTATFDLSPNFIIFAIKNESSSNLCSKNLERKRLESGCGKRCAWVESWLLGSRLLTRRCRKIIKPPFKPQVFASGRRGIEKQTVPSTIVGLCSGRVRNLILRCCCTRRSKPAYTLTTTSSKMRKGMSVGARR